MEVTIDIDIGGTFTDCVVFADEQIVRSKSPTTSYNLSVGFKRAIDEAALELDLSIEELLSSTQVIRYSTTLAMNVLLERGGPKLGLITTAGHEHVILIGRARQWADGLHPRERRYVYKAKKPEPLIPIDMTVGITERIDSHGKVVIPIDRDEVREQIQHLVDKGARGFVVSLLWSFLNPDHERVVKEVIQEEYPERFLGNLPILLSSDVHPKWHEYARTNMAVLSAYLHTGMTEQLSTLGEELRDLGYRRPLVIINNVGGAAKVTRTRAVDTYGAGPTAGLFASGYLAQLYGFNRVLSTDMGGTSFDYGLVLDGAPGFYVDWPVVDRWATEASMVEVASIGAGGGSIAWINRVMANRLEVGPKSAGSNPGPACYDLGGTEATVTDADMVLGFINPDNYLGGKVRLSKDLATRAVERVAKPLGMSVIEAAGAIKKIVDGNMADILSKELALKGYSSSEFVLFAYGGAGPTHCGGYAARLGISKIVVPAFAGVFCALGGSSMDLKHIYEGSRHLVISRVGDDYQTDSEAFNSMVDFLTAQAARDIRAEGFKVEDVQFRLELDMKYATTYTYTRVVSPALYVRNKGDLELLREAFHRTYIRRYTEVAIMEAMAIEVDNFYLSAFVPLPKFKMPRYELSGENPAPALKGSRQAYWQENQGWKDTPVYDANLLRPGNVTHGPCIVEADNTTVVVPPGMKYTIDEFVNGLMEWESM